MHISFNAENAKIDFHLTPTVNTRAVQFSVFRNFRLNPARPKRLTPNLHRLDLKILESLSKFRNAPVKYKKYLA